MALIRDLERQLSHGSEPGVYGEILRTRPGDVPMVAASDGSGTPIPIGSTGDRALDLIQGLDGIITKQQAALREADRIAKDMAIISERTAKFLGGQVERSVQTELSLEGFRAGAGFAAPSVAPTSARTWEDDDYESSGPMDDTFAAQVNRGGVPRMRTRTQRGRPEAAPSGLHSPTSWDEGKELFAGRRGGLSLSNIRQQAAESMAHRLSDWNMGANVVPDEMGRWHYAAGEVVDGHSVGGQFVSREFGQRAMRSRAFSTGVKKVVSGVADSGSLMEGVSSGIPAVGKVVGVAGAAWYGGNKLLDFAEDQRAQNLEYQRILGGGNAEGFGERFGEGLFRFGQRGVMGGREAEALYKGALDIYGTGEGGGRDQMRGEAQDLGVRLYKETGMSPDESLRFVRMAARQGSDALSEIGTALISTSRAAREAGVNATEARGYFERAFKYQAQFGAAGALAAGAQARAQAQWGEMGANWDFSNMQSDAGLFQAAAALGMSPNQVIGSSATASGQLMVTQAQEGRAKEFLGSAIKPEGREYMRKKYPNGVGNLTDSKWKQLATEMLQKDLFNGNVIDYADMLRSMSFPVPEGKGTDAAIAAAVGILQMNYMEHPFGGGDEELIQAAETEQRIQERYASGNITQEWSAQDNSDLASELGFSPKEGSPGEFVIEDTSKFQALQDYTEITRENLGDDRLGSGRNFAAEGLLANWDESALYVVDTADGPREVNFDELVQFYRDQLATGDVWISQGKDRGQSVADLLGFDRGEGGDSISAKTDPGRTGNKVDKFETTRDQEGLDKIVVELRPKGNLDYLIESQVVSGGIGSDQASGVASGTATDPRSRQTGRPNGG